MQEPYKLKADEEWPEEVAHLFANRREGEEDAKGITIRPHAWYDLLPTDRQIRTDTPSYSLIEKVRKVVYIALQKKQSHPGKRGGRSGFRKSLNFEKIRGTSPRLSKSQKTTRNSLPTKPTVSKECRALPNLGSTGCLHKIEVCTP